jgi:hypothetical protein
MGENELRKTIDSQIMDLMGSRRGTLGACASLGRKEYGRFSILVAPILYCFGDFFDWNSCVSYLLDNL